MKIQNLLFSSVLVAMPLMVSASTSALELSSGSNTLSTEFEISKKVDREKKFKIDITAQASNMVENVGTVVGNQYFGQVDLDYKTESNNTKKSFDLSLRQNSANELMFSFKDTFIEAQYSRSRLAFGRQALRWSKADEIWSLGKVNNRENFDFFEPGQEGLVGLFYDEKYSNGLSLGVFASFLYLPEINPGLNIDKDNGTIECFNPWCKAPSVSAHIEGKDIPIYYNVNYPEIDDVVFRHSLGLKAGFENDLFSIDAYYLRKPENSLSVSAEVAYQIDENRIFADVTPEFYYHDVKGGNLKIKISKQLSLYGSAISTVPEKRPDKKQPYIEYTGLKPKKKQEDYLSGGAAYTNGLFNAHAGYIARVSEFDKENDVLAQYPRWSQAVNLRLSHQFSGKIYGMLDLKYDMLTEDRLTILKTSYRVTKSLIASLGVQIIGTNPDKPSYWNDYSNNDSVYSSVKYRF